MVKEKNFRCKRLFRRVRDPLT